MQDVETFNQYCCDLYSNQQARIDTANTWLADFGNRSDAIDICSLAIDGNYQAPTKIIASTILRNFVRDSWRTLREDQCENLKVFILNTIDKWIQAPEFSSALAQIDDALAYIILFDWPERWPDIMTNLINAASVSSGACMNVLHIISQISIMVVDMKEQILNSGQISQLTNALKSCSQEIFQLIEYVLLNSSYDENVIKQAMVCMRSTTKWLESTYIFETQLAVSLCTTFLPNPSYQLLVLAIFGEVAEGHIPDRYLTVVPQIFNTIVQSLVPSFPEDVDYRELELINFEFTKSLLFTLSAFLNKYGVQIEQTQDLESLNYSLTWITRLMDVAEEVDNMKTCCEVWRNIARRYYVEKSQISPEFYQEFFPLVRRIIIMRMVRPSEVIICEDENGQITRASVQNTNNIILYQTMKDTLIFLTHIDYAGTYEAIQERIQFLHENGITASVLNSMCWSAGAVSGAFATEDEKQFFMTVLKELLQFSTIPNLPTDIKAVISSNIMFVCSQYPRFLASHWIFMKTVVQKLFEFMHHEFPGVMEMAVDTFKSIATSKCRISFLRINPSEKELKVPYLEYILDNMDGIVSSLPNILIVQMFEAISAILSGENEEGKKVMLTNALMSRLNERWVSRLSNPELDNTDCLYDILFMIQCNSVVAENVGSAYHIQLQTIFENLLMLYTQTSNKINSACQQQGEMAMRNEDFKLAFDIKAGSLRVISQAIKSMKNSTIFKTQITPAIMYAVLNDNLESQSACKVPEVLKLLAVLINCLKAEASPYIADIYVCVIAPTIELIAADYESFMEFRIVFEELCDEIINNCPVPLLSTDMKNIPEEFFRGVFWGAENPNSDICIKSISVVINMFTMIESKADQEFKNNFYRSYYVFSVLKAFEILTDTSHKFAFSENTKLIKKLLSIQNDFNEINQLAQALCEQHIKHEITFFLYHLDHLYSSINNIENFRAFLRDFLIEVNRYSMNDSDLYKDENQQQIEAERRQNEQIPGLTGPAPVVDYIDLSDFL